MIHNKRACLCWMSQFLPLLCRLLQKTPTKKHSLNKKSLFCYFVIKWYIAQFLLFQGTELLHTFHLEPVWVKCITHFHYFINFKTEDTSWSLFPAEYAQSKKEHEGILNDWPNCTNYVLKHICVILKKTNGYWHASKHTNKATLNIHIQATEQDVQILNDK